MTTTIPSSIDEAKLFVAVNHKRKANMIKNKERDRESVGIIKIDNDEKSCKQDHIDLDFQLKTLQMYNLILQSAHSSRGNSNNKLDEKNVRNENQSLDLESKSLHYSDIDCRSYNSDYNQFLVLEECFPKFQYDESGVTDDEDKENYDNAIFEMEL